MRHFTNAICFVINVVVRNVLSLVEPSAEVSNLSRVDILVAQKQMFSAALAAANDPREAAYFNWFNQKTWDPFIIHCFNGQNISAKQNLGLLRNFKYLESDKYVSFNIVGSNYCWRIFEDNSVKMYI